MSAPAMLRYLLRTSLLLIPGVALAFRAPPHPPLPDLDRRSQEAPVVETVPNGRAAALDHLRRRLAHVRVRFDPVVGTPRLVSAADGFLSGPNGEGRGVSGLAGGVPPGEAHRATLAFLIEHRQLFGHGPEALEQARLKRDFVTPHSGLRTVVWQQELDGIAVLGGTLISHTTKAGELVTLGSRFVPQLDQAANHGAARRRGPRHEPRWSAAAAVAAAAGSVGEALAEAEVRTRGAADTTPDRRQRFTAAPLKGDIHASLAWLPMSRDELRLCWEIILTSRARGGMYRVFVDADSGDVLVRQGLTYYRSDASFRVFTSDSPSPFSPGWPAPSAAQPPLTARSLVTLSSLNTNASPLGWIADGDNQTLGNNVDAHLDRDADDQPDLPRPHGSPARVFDFPLDLAEDPYTYGEASVAQLFYWNNWMHDRLYELGFTEAAGNFQTTNFGRGGLGNDAMLAQSQDGEGTDNANISLLPEGYPPLMQMFIWTGPTPRRDSSFDAEILLHEYTHGLSHRLVGGGEGLFATQSRGMGEGWSDFYALALLSEPADDVDAAYAAGAYSSYQFFGLAENYYFGIRRYPYSTDLAKNPLTFTDIDPFQASGHPGVPRNPIFAGFDDPDEVHSQGEVWCVTLWDARAALIHKHGYSAGNELILRLVTDGMVLSPPDPTFLEARDAILQADLVLSGGANQTELWAAFAKRGMGVLATSPSSDSTIGVGQSFEVPGDLGALPGSDVAMHGPVGGPLAPSAQVYTLTNLATEAILWSAFNPVEWLELSATGGTLPVGGRMAVTVSLTPAAYVLTAGLYTASITFSNHATSRTLLRRFTLSVGTLDFFTEFFEDAGAEADLAYSRFTFSPDGSPNFYFACREPASAFAVDTSDGDRFEFGGTYGAPEVALTNGAQVFVYGQPYRTFFLGAGYVQFLDNLRTVYDPNNLGGEHFAQPHVTAYTFLQAVWATTATWKVLDDRVAVTFETYGTNIQAQTELFFDGRIRITYLEARLPRLTPTAIGLSRGLPVEHFQETAFRAYGACLRLALPPNAREGDGTLASQARLTLPQLTASNVTVLLRSSSPSNVAVPNRLTVPAGQRELSFDLTVVDDSLLDGTQPVWVTARTTRFGMAEATVQADDNEAAALALTLPAAAMENEAGAFIQGRVSITATPASDISVLLSSSDTTELRPQASVVIPAGQTSAAFMVEVPDDRLADGPQNAVITAHVANWLDATAAVTVGDNEPATLALVLPPEICEAGVTMFQAGLLLLSGVAASNVNVALISSHPHRLQVPPSLVIPAGQDSVRFDLTLLDNAGADPPGTVTLGASAPAWAAGNATLIVRDDETPSAPFNLSPESGVLGLPTQVRLSWQDLSPLGEVVSNGDFERGALESWQTESTESEDANFYINSGRFNPYGPERPTPAYAGSFCAVGDQLGPSLISLSQVVNVPACAGRVFLRWVDRVRNYADAFNEAQRFWVEVRSALPDFSFEPVVVYSTQPGAIPLNDWIEREVEITRFRGLPIEVRFNVLATLYYFTLFIDNVSVMAEPGAIPTTYDVYLGPAPALTAADFIGTTTNLAFDTPRLAAATQYYWQVVARTLGTQASEVATFSTRRPDHLAWSSIAPTQLLEQPFLIALTAKDEFEQTVTNFSGTVHLAGLNATPDSAGPWVASSLPPQATFTNGLWSGLLRVLEPVAEMFLRATDDAGRDFESGHFAVLAPNDIALTATASSNPAAVGDPLTYRLVITNTGPAVANGVTLTNLLPAGVTFLSAQGTNATCTHQGDAVSCRIEQLDALSQSTIEIVVRPESAGSLTNEAWVARGEADFLLGNNTVRVVTGAQAPALSIEDATVAEANPTARQTLFFAVNLRPASARPVSVRFATSEQTAREGSDFIGTNGLLTFDPGQTRKSVAVDLLVDLVDEDTENFTVALSEPANAVLEQSVAVGTITDPDPLPEVTVGGASAREGTTMLVPISLNHPSSRPTSVGLATRDASARAPSDYLGTNVDLVVPPGATLASVPILIRTDALCEPTESLYLSAYNATNVRFIHINDYLDILDGVTPPKVALAELRLAAEEFSPPNQFVDPGEHVTLAVTLRTVCDARITNVMATLLPGGGIELPSSPQHYGVLGPGQPPVARDFSFTAAGTNGARLTLTFEFADASHALNRQTVRLHLGPTPDFGIASLSTHGAQTVDMSMLGDDFYTTPAGLAASDSTLFYRGEDGLAALPLDDPPSASLTAYGHYHLVSNLRTETIYLLAGGDTEPVDGYVTTLLELDGATGDPTGNHITLQQPVQALAGEQYLGLYSGYDRLVIHSGSDDVFSISLPWGRVTRLGRVSQGTHLTTSTRGYWGVTEHVAGEDWLVYARDSRTIARKRVSDGFTTTVASFENLGEMAAMTVSIPRGRWCFATTSSSQFLGTAPTVALGDATFSITEELRITSLTHDGAAVTIRFPTIAGRRYRLEHTSDLTHAGWTAVLPERIGTGGIMEITQQASALGTSRFYRLRLVP